MKQDNHLHLSLLSNIAAVTSHADDFASYTRAFYCTSDPRNLV